MCQVKNSCIAA